MYVCIQTTARACYMVVIKVSQYGKAKRGSHRMCRPKREWRPPSPPLPSLWRLVGRRRFMIINQRIVYSMRTAGWLHLVSICRSSCPSSSRRTACGTSSFSSPSSASQFPAQPPSLENSTDRNNSYKTKHLLDVHALRTSYPSLVQPYMSYCCEIWGNTYPYRLRKLCYRKKDVN